jgi:NADH-quinone oxidoreductase subunit E
MVVSDQLDQFFTEKMKEYPTQRSFLVPMLLYTQDELGYLSHEAVTYIAGKVGLSELEVRNVITYYGMLTMKPRGKFNVQVCTNISCMLRGAEEVYQHCQKKLGIGHKGTTPDGTFSLEEVECIGGCSWGPAMQVNYDYHEKLTAEKVDKVLESYADKAKQ